MDYFGPDRVLKKPSGLRDLPDERLCVRFPSGVHFNYYNGESKGEPGEGGRKVESVGVKKGKELNLEEIEDLHTGSPCVFSALFSGDKNRDTGRDCTYTTREVVSEFTTHCT